MQDLNEREEMFLEDILDLGDQFTIDEIYAFTGYSKEETLKLLEILRVKGYFENFGEKGFIWRRIK